MEIRISAKAAEFKSLLMEPFLWIGLATLVLPPMAFKLITHFVPLELENKLLLITWAICIFSGLVFVLPFLLLTLSTAQWRVTANGVETLSCLIFNRRRRWAKSDIASIGVFYRRKKEDRYRAVLEISRTDGKRDEIATANPFVLRYMASLMRGMLGVPATPLEVTAL